MHLTCLKRSSYFPSSVLHIGNTQQRVHILFYLITSGNTTPENVSLCGIYTNRLWFLFRKMSASTWSADSAALFLLRTTPATENTLSAGTLVAGRQRYFLAKAANRRNCPLWIFHHNKGSSLSSSTGAAWHAWISASAHTFPQPCDDGNEPKRTSIAVSFFFFGGSSMLTSNIGSAASCCRGISLMRFSYTCPLLLSKKVQRLVTWVDSCTEEEIFWQVR